MAGGEHARFGHGHADAAVRPRRPGPGSCLHQAREPPRAHDRRLQLVAQFGVRDLLDGAAANIRATRDEPHANRLRVADGAYPRPTDVGRELPATFGAEASPITARIRGGIPVEDLAAAGRVVALVNERADAELKTLTARPTPSTTTA